MTNMFRTPDAWWSAMAKRPQTEQEALQTDLRNAYISIHFDNDLGMRDRAALLHHLQGFLLEHPHFNGERWLRFFGQGCKWKSVGAK